MQYYSHFLLMLSSLFFFSDAIAQPDSSIREPVLSNYHIKITIAGLPDTVLYLQGYVGGHAFIADSAALKSSTAIFKSKSNSLPCGLYSIVNRQDSVLLDVILNADDKFALTTTQAGLYTQRHFDGSEENTTLFTFQTRLAQLPNRTTSAVRDIVDEYTETAPQSFVSKYLNAVYGQYERGVGDSIPQAMARQLYEVIRHTDLGEPRLLHAPLPIYNLLYEYLTNQDIHDTDTLQAVVDTVLQRCSHPTVKKFYLNYFFRLFDRHDPDFDPILLHLYDDFDHDWIAPEFAQWYHRKVERIRKIVPGAKIPNLISHDIQGKAHSTDQILSKYTILWFWDPDCDHCITETPKLHQFYQEYGKLYDFEVFAVELTGDYERWKAFSDKYQLWDWINLSTSMGETSHDFFDYFDIMTTPVLFLIDNLKGHTIIARQITLKQVNDFFDLHHLN